MQNYTKINYYSKPIVYKKVSEWVSEWSECVSDFTCNKSKIFEKFVAV